MLADKMQRILDLLATRNIPLHGVTIYANGGGELTFDMGGQLDLTTHAMILKRGFIYHGQVYIYRP